MVFGQQHLCSWTSLPPTTPQRTAPRKAPGGLSDGGGGGGKSELLEVVPRTALWQATALADSHKAEGEGLTETEEAWPAGCSSPASAAVGVRRTSPGSSLHMSRPWLVPLLRFLCSQERGKGGGTEGSSGCCCLAWPPSQLLQTAVHLPFALFPCPGPALGAELLQVFFEVLMVHGPVAGRLAVRLQTTEDEMRGPCLTLLSRLSPHLGLRGWDAQQGLGPFFV